MNDVAELIEKQNIIIKKQAEVINGLFLLLLQHIPAAELDEIKEVEKINEIAKIRESIGGYEDDYC